MERPILCQGGKVMQVYKTFLKISLKSIISAFAYIAAFLALSMMITNSGNKSDISSFVSEKMDVAIVDYDHSVTSKALYHFVDKKHNIKSIQMKDEAWRDELFYRNVDYILIIEKGFADHYDQKDAANYMKSYTNPDSNTSFIIRSEVETFLRNLNHYKTAGFNEKESIEKAQKVSVIHTQTDLVKNQKKIEKPTAMSYFFTFAPYVLLCILINTIGPMLMIWNRPEIKTRTEISSLSLGKRNLALICAVATCAMVVFVIYLGTCVQFFKGDFFTLRGLYYTINAFLCLLVCISATYLVAQLSHKLNSLSMWSNILGLSTSFLGGVFVIRELLPDQVVLFSKCIPTYWYINITEELKYFDGTLSKLAYQSAGMQLLFAFALYAIALIVIKNKQQRI